MGRKYGIGQLQFSNGWNTRVKMNRNIQITVQWVICVPVKKTINKIRHFPQSSVGRMPVNLKGKRGFYFFIQHEKLLHCLGKTIYWYLAKCRMLFLRLRPLAGCKIIGTRLLHFGEHSPILSIREKSS